MLFQEVFYVKSMQLGGFLFYENVKMHQQNPAKSSKFMNLNNVPMA